MWNLYPYSNFHELNQDWILSMIKKFENELKQAIDYKTIHYSDPLQWNITTQYAPNTVVVDENTGIAYISKDAVPSGVLLSDTNYWMVIFDYQKIYNKIMSGVAFNDKDNETASKDLLVNDLVWYHGDLYRVTRAISEGSKYIIGTNLIKTTIENLLSNYYGRDRVSQLINDTLTVSGDYTLNAGDISETSNNRTEKVTSDREIDIDGNDSIHVDGVTTINRGGAITRVYGSSFDSRVMGAFTEKFEDTTTSTYNGKRIIKSKDNDVTAESYIVHFPDKTVNLHDITKGMYINLDDYGAKGDGITNDTDAINNAIKDANIYKMPLLFGFNKKYLCGEINTNIECSIDLNKSAIKVLDNSEYVFKYSNSDIELSISSDSLTTNGVTNSALYNKTFTIQTPVLLGTRINTDETFYQRINLMTDSTGNFINTYIPKIIDGTYLCTNIRALDEPLYMKNGSFELPTDRKTATVVICYRNRTTFSNLSITGSINTPTWSGGVFSIHDCFGIKLENIIGKNPISTPASGYIIGLYETSNTVVKDCIFTDFTTSWGSIGVSQICNAKFINTITNRFDIHYYLNGYYDCENCTFSTFEFSGGSGTILLKGCTILTGINLRNDLPILLNGNLHLIDCFAYTNNNYLVNLSNNNVSSTDYKKIFQSFELIIDNLEGRYNSLVLIKITNSDMQSNINIIVKNTALQADININTVSTINKILYDNVFGNQSFSYATDKFIILNSTITMQGNMSKINNLKLINNTLKDILYTINARNVVIIGNELQIDKGNSISATNYVINNNIITADTKTNLAKWNLEAV